MSTEQAEKRFAFGRNWERFLRVINEERVRAAQSSLCNVLGVKTLEGRTFLDVGSGSGLFSLAARRLGARVVSFDTDPQSVACTEELKHRFFRDSSHWRIELGSVLDTNYMRSLSGADVVYSWGVLHHTGEMYRALQNTVVAVAEGGVVVVAIYNDQGRGSRAWASIKRLYNRLPGGLRFVIVVPAFIRLWGPTFFRDLFTGRGLQTWRGYYADRGMSPWHDVVDWVGGYPFEVAKPEEIFEFFRARGFELKRLKTCAGGIGCNEYVFRKKGKRE